MNLTALWVLVPSFCVVAFLYAAVGHGGASGYLGISVLVGLPREEMVPIALVLNLIVAGMSFWNYFRAGYFSGRKLLPFVLTSIPGAFWGGSVTVDSRVFALLLGIGLVGAGLRLLGLGRAVRPRWAAEPRLLWPAGLVLGFILGVLAGVTGVGGGIFLSPLLLFLNWADAKQTAALSSAFIVVNSASGLLAHSLRGSLNGALLGPLVTAVLVGGGLGAHLGARRFSPVWLQRLLGIVLLVASLKLLSQAL
jgi:uncharacterized protein